VVGHGAIPARARTGNAVRRTLRGKQQREQEPRIFWEPEPFYVIIKEPLPDLTPLTEIGFKFPEPFRVKAEALRMKMARQPVFSSAIRRRQTSTISCWQSLATRCFPLSNTVSHEIFVPA
jgi:hypothetical protein